jgi:hypothetical protein
MNSRRLIMTNALGPGVIAAFAALHESAAGPEPE